MKKEILENLTQNKHSKLYRSTFAIAGLRTEVYFDFTYNIMNRGKTFNQVFDSYISYNKSDDGRKLLVRSRNEDYPTGDNIIHIMSM